jgi:hypothetical protein
MRAIRWLHTNLLLSASAVTVSSEATAYPKANLYNFRKGKYFQFNDAGESPFTHTIVFTTGGNSNVDFVALLGHNIAAAATIKFQGNDTDSWGSPSLDETITYRAEDMYKKFTEVSHVYWRVAITTTVAAPKIGELVVGVSAAPAGMTAWEYSRADEMLQAVHETDYGQKWAYNLNSVPRKRWELSWRNASATTMTAIDTLFAAVLGSMYPFAFVPDTSATDVYYVRFDGGVKRTARAVGSTTYYDIDISLIEEVRGRVV